MIAAVIAAAGSVPFTAAPARADTGVSVGPFFGQATSLGGIVSLGLRLPIVPIAPQVSVAVPFNNGRYAATGEVLIGNKSYVGAGIGFGAMNAAVTTAGLVDVIAGTRIAPNLSLEGRLYTGGTEGTNGFVGLHLSI